MTTTDQLVARIGSIAIERIVALELDRAGCTPTVARIALAARRIAWTLDELADTYEGVT